MKKKPIFHLKETDLNKDQIIALTKLAMCQLEISKHTLNNVFGGVLGFSKIVLIDFKNFVSNYENNSTFQTDELKQYYTNFKRSYIDMERIISSIATFHLFFSGYQQESILITKPIEAINILKNRWNNIHIKISHRSLKSLEIFFPSNLFFGIIFELINNAYKNCTKKRCEILIEWYIKDSKFECHIHDNGTGIIPSSHRGFIAADMLPRISNIRLKALGGIRIINKIIKLSRGMILFARSKKLRGTHIIISFPVFAHYSQKYRS